MHAHFDPSKLRQIRLERGLTREELAVKARVSVASVALWEQAKVCPRPAMLVALASALSVSETELLSEIEPRREPAA